MLQLLQLKSYTANSKVNSKVFQFYDFCLGDSKVGPVNMFVHEDSSFKHEVEYEFGMAFYWNIAVCGVILIQSVVYAARNPYVRSKEQIEKEKLLNEIENYF